MVRLGAKHSVKGYLADVRSHALLGELDNSPLPKHVAENWDKIFADLKRKWCPIDFMDALIEFHADVAWRFAHGSKRSALGREEHFRFCCPSVVDLVHSDYSRPNEPCWTERGLMIQGWKGFARQGKAKIEVIPSRVVFSPHALERIYERTGGCDYNEFPALVGRFVDTILQKLDVLLDAGVLIVCDNDVGVTAIPVEGGLAIIEINLIATHSALPQLGSALAVSGGKVSQRMGRYRLINATDFEDFSVGGVDGSIAISRLYNVRTFLGSNEIDGKRTDSLQYLDIVLDHLDSSKISLYALMEVDHPEFPNVSAKKPVDQNSQYFRGLIADTVESLDWLKLHRADHLFVFYEGQGELAGAAISASRP